MNVSDSNRISIGQKGIVQVRVLDDDEILLTGTQVGSTELLFWDDNRERKAIRIEVVPALDYLARDIKRVLDDVQNLKVEVVGQNVVLDGKLLTMEDATRVELIAKELGGEKVINLCTVDRGPENGLVEKFIVDMFGLRYGERAHHRRHGLSKRLCLQSDTKRPPARTG